MHAVVDIAGSQIRVQKGDRVRVSKIDAEPGDKIDLDRVLLLSSENESTVGAPMVKGASVKATVLEHGKSKKVIVFKMKRRKGYRNRRGHRQHFTDLQIDDISVP